MDIKERLRRINANSFYGVGQIDRDSMIKEVEYMLKKLRRENNMAEKSNSEWFIKTVENTANTAIAAGRNVNEVIHDAIEVIYGRKNINELLPSGWIVVSHDCSDCVYNQAPHTDEPCFRCYNRFFDDLDEGPYTDNFKSKEEEDQKSTGDDPQRDCVDCRFDSLNIDDHPCRSCYYKDEKPCFRPIEKSAPVNGKDK